MLVNRVPSSLLPNVGELMKITQKRQLPARVYLNTTACLYGFRLTQQIAIQLPTQNPGEGFPKLGCATSLRLECFPHWHLNQIRAAQLHVAYGQATSRRP